MHDQSTAPVVLIVDDSSIVRRQVSNALSKTDVCVLEASDGLGALEVIESRAVALLITDINMPRMSGVELLTTLASRGTKVPTIVLTSETQVEALRDARSAGALAWITKPFDPAHLARAVVHALTRLSLRVGGT